MKATARREYLQEMGERLLSGATRDGIAADLDGLDRAAVIRPEVGVPAEVEHYLILQTTTHEPTTQGTPATVCRPVRQPLPVRAAAEPLAKYAHETAERTGALVITTVVLACTRAGVPLRGRAPIWIATWPQADQGGDE